VEEKIVLLKAGKRYSLCPCGKSQALPFCDGAHKAYNEEKGANYKSLKITPDKDLELKIASTAWDS
jgi:CDGSH-type Zn-finger protein